MSIKDNKLASSNIVDSNIIDLSTSQSFTHNGKQYFCTEREIIRVAEIVNEAVRNFDYRYNLLSPKQRKEIKQKSRLLDLGRSLYSVGKVLLTSRHSNDQRECIFKMLNIVERDCGQYEQMGTAHDTLVKMYEVKGVLPEVMTKQVKILRELGFDKLAQVFEDGLPEQKAEPNEPGPVNGASKFSDRAPK